jgi:ABC-type amino acid transport substrate-binding protein
MAILLLGSMAESDSPSPDSLRVCLEAKSAPFSVATGRSHGLDYEIAELVAEALGRTLAVHWFDASEEEELSLPLQVNGLLSRARCDLVAGYPLIQDGLGEAAIAELRFSEPGGRPIRVRLSTLRASLPYLSLPLTLISAGEGVAISRLEDVVGLRLAVERESLASAIAMAYGGARLQDQILRVSFEDDAIFQALEAGTADVAFIEQHRFEIYRTRVPNTRLRESHYRHGLAVNTGFVGIAPPLLEEVNRALRPLIATGRIAEAVEDHGLGYSPPVKPAILPPITPRLLARRNEGP